MAEQLLRPPPGDDERAADEQEVVRPPFGWLLVALGAVSAAALLLLFSGRTVDLVGYVLATAVTVLAIGRFRAVDSRRRSNPSYVLPPFALNLPMGVITAAVLVIGLVVGGVHVWRFADVVART